MKRRSYLLVFFLLTIFTGCQKENNPMQSPELSDFNLNIVRVGEPSFTLTNPKSKSTGAFTFKTNDASLVTIQGNVVTIKKSGTCVITAIQQATESFSKDSITAKLIIAPRLWPSLGFVIPDKKVGDPPFILTPKSNSNAEITFKSDNAAVAVIEGHLVTIKGPGKAVITAYQAQSGIYEASSVSENLIVTEASTAETLKDIDGNVYKTVKIGNQVWMMENLRTTHYRDGTIIQNVTDNSSWAAQLNGAYCNYNNSIELGKTYGFLYNWYAVNSDHKLAPQGWHIPTSAEWTILYNYIGGDRYSGGKIQESGISHWSNDTGASNITQFTGLPAGSRNADGTYHGITSDSNWWTATANPNGTASYYNLYVKGYIEIAESIKSFGYSVRCIKD